MQTPTFHALLFNVGVIKNLLKGVSSSFHIKHVIYRAS